MRAFLAALAAFFAAAALAMSLYGTPITSWVLSRSMSAPVTLEKVRWIHPGQLRAAGLRIDADRFSVALETVEVRGLLEFLRGGPMRLRFEQGRVSGYALTGSELLIKRKKTGLYVFGRTAGAEGRVRGGLLWFAGKLSKAHGLFVLTPIGMERVPRPLRTRLLATPSGPAFYAQVAANHVRLLGRGGPIVEAAWRSV